MYIRQTFISVVCGIVLSGGYTFFADAAHSALPKIEEFKSRIKDLAKAKLLDNFDYETFYRDIRASFSNEYFEVLVEEFGSDDTALLNRKEKEAADQLSEAIIEAQLEHKKTISDAQLAKLEGAVTTLQQQEIKAAGASSFVQDLNQPASQQALKQTFVEQKGSKFATIFENFTLFSLSDVEFNQKINSQKSALQTLLQSIEDLSVSPYEVFALQTQLEVIETMIAALLDARAQQPIYATADINSRRAFEADLIVIKNNLSEAFKRIADLTGPLSRNSKIPQSFKDQLFNLLKAFDQNIDVTELLKESVIENPVKTDQDFEKLVQVEEGLVLGIDNFIFKVRTALDDKSKIITTQDIELISNQLDSMQGIIRESLDEIDDEDEKNISVRMLEISEELNDTAEKLEELNNILEDFLNLYLEETPRDFLNLFEKSQNLLDFVEKTRNAIDNAQAAVYESFEHETASDATQSEVKIETNNQQLIVYVGDKQEVFKANYYKNLVPEFQKITSGFKSMLALTSNEVAQISTYVTGTIQAAKKLMQGILTAPVDSLTRSYVHQALTNFYALWRRIKLVTGFVPQAKREPLLLKNAELKQVTNDLKQLEQAQRAVSLNVAKNNTGTNILVMQDGASIYAIDALSRALTRVKELMNEGSLYDSLLQDQGQRMVIKTTTAKLIEKLNEARKAVGADKQANLATIFDNQLKIITDAAQQVASDAWLTGKASDKSLWETSLSIVLQDAFMLLYRSHMNGLDAQSELKAAVQDVVNATFKNSKKTDYAQIFVDLAKSHTDMLAKALVPFGATIIGATANPLVPTNATDKKLLATFLDQVTNLKTSVDGLWNKTETALTEFKERARKSFDAADAYLRKKLVQENTPDSATIRPFENMLLPVTVAEADNFLARIDEFKKRAEQNKTLNAKNKQTADSYDYEVKRLEMYKARLLLERFYLDKIKNPKYVTLINDPSLVRTNLEKEELAYIEPEYKRLVQALNDATAAQEKALQAFTVNYASAPLIAPLTLSEWVQHKLSLAFWRSREMLASFYGDKTMVAKCRQKITDLYDAVGNWEKQVSKIKETAIQSGSGVLWLFQYDLPTFEQRLASAAQSLNRFSAGISSGELQKIDFSSALGAVMAEVGLAYRSVQGGLRQLTKDPAIALANKEMKTALEQLAQRLEQWPVEFFDLNNSVLNTYGNAQRETFKKLISSYLEEIKKYEKGLTTDTAPAQPGGDGEIAV